MGSHGIKDRVAIVGMGCTNFVEAWDKGLDDMVIEAANSAYASATRPGVAFSPGRFGSSPIASSSS